MRPVLIALIALFVGGLMMSTSVQAGDCLQGHLRGLGGGGLGSLGHGGGVSALELAILQQEVLRRDILRVNRAQRLLRLRGNVRRSNALVELRLLERLAGRRRGVSIGVGPLFIDINAGRRGLGLRGLRARRLLRQLR